MANDGIIPQLAEWAVAGRPLRDGDESGDLHLVKPFPNGLLVAVVDGLGHGHEAAYAARITVATLEEHAGDSVIALVTRCHEALRHARGVVMTLASINTKDSTMTWLGVGNVEGLLLRADALASSAREYVVMRGGVVGEQLPPLHASVLPIRQDDTLILATDGISHGFADRLSLSGEPRAIADSILALHGKTTDDALALVLRYVGRAQ